MSLRERVAKWTGHGERLASLFFELKENYAFLEPLLFDRAVIGELGARERARGFEAIKFALFYTCIQDLAKLTLDQDERTPSIAKLMDALSDSALRAGFRNAYVFWKLTAETTDPPEVAAALRKMEAREEIERAEQFDAMYEEAVSQWAALKDSPALKAFQTIRDKLTAHSELRKVGDEYKLLDIGTLGLKWGDLGTAISDLQPVVERLSLLVSNTSVDFAGHERHLRTAVDAFWRAWPRSSARPTRE